MLLNKELCYSGGKEEELGWEVKVLYLKAFPSTALATIHQLDQEDRRKLIANVYAEKQLYSSPDRATIGDQVL